MVLSAGFVSIAARWRGPGSRRARPGRVRARQNRGRRRDMRRIIVVVLGNWWWTTGASSYARYVYKPLEASTTVASDGRLALALRDPGWISLRRTDDLVADHGHLMHLFIVSPALDRLWHLHPDETGSGTFEQPLPHVPQGDYELFADVVHSTAISETITGRLSTSEIHGSRDGATWLVRHVG